MSNERQGPTLADSKCLFQRGVPTVKTELTNEQEMKGGS